MSPDDTIRVRHMVEAAETALSFVKDRPRADLDTDAMLRLALTRVIEILGEAAADVSVQGRAKAPAVRWPAIVGMRNRLVHAYFDVDNNILWTTVNEDLPVLLQQLKPLLES
jgi:uncharacterized protein with HEPN domain